MLDGRCLSPQDHLRHRNRSGDISSQKIGHVRRARLAAFEPGCAGPPTRIGSFGDTLGVNGVMIDSDRTPAGIIWWTVSQPGSACGRRRFPWNLGPSVVRGRAATSTCCRWTRWWTGQWTAVRIWIWRITSESSPMRNPSSVVAALEQGRSSSSPGTGSTAAIPWAPALRFGVLPTFLPLALNHDALGEGHCVEASEVVTRVISPRPLESTPAKKQEHRRPQRFVGQARRFTWGCGAKPSSR